MKPFRKLRARILIVCAVGTTIVLAAMAMVSYRISAGHMQTQFDESFASSVFAVQSHLREQPVISHTWLLETEQSSGLMIGVQSDGGYGLYSGGNHSKDGRIASALATASERFRFDALGRPGDWRAATVEFFAEGARVSASRVPVGEEWLTLILVKDRTGEFREIASLRLGFLLAATGATAFLIAFAWVFSAWAIRPAEESRKRQSAFVAAASHEYRSPVAVIQMAAENMEKAPPDVIPRFTAMILGECARLTRLTRDMLRLAGADNESGMDVTPEPVNPEAPVLSAYESFQELAAAKHIALQLDLPPAPLPKVSCDRQRIEQLLAILLDNAVRHTPEGGAITLGAEAAKRHVRFTVADTGPGIPDAQKKRVFERFYQGDDSRGDKEHYGLGLSIAAEIAALHKAKLTVEDAPGGGCLFTLSVSYQRHSPNATGNDRN